MGAGTMTPAQIPPSPYFTHTAALLFCLVVPAVLLALRHAAGVAAGRHPARPDWPHALRAGEHMVPLYFAAIALINLLVPIEGNTSSGYPAPTWFWTSMFMVPGALVLFVGWDRPWTRGLLLWPLAFHAVLSAHRLLVEGMVETASVPSLSSATTAVALGAAMALLAWPLRPYDTPPHPDAPHLGGPAVCIALFGAFLFQPAEGSMLHLQHIVFFTLPTALLLMLAQGLFQHRTLAEQTTTLLGVLFCGLLPLYQEKVGGPIAFFSNEEVAISLQTFPAQAWHGVLAAAAFLLAAGAAGRLLFLSRRQALDALRRWSEQGFLAFVQRLPSLYLVAAGAVFSVIHHLFLPMPFDPFSVMVACGIAVAWRAQSSSRPQDGWIAALAAVLGLALFPLHATAASWPHWLVLHAPLLLIGAAVVPRMDPHHKPFWFWTAVALGHLFLTLDTPVDPYPAPQGALLWQAVPIGAPSTFMASWSFLWAACAGIVWGMARTPLPRPLRLRPQGRETHAEPDAFPAGIKDRVGWIVLLAIGAALTTWNVWSTLAHGWLQAYAWQAGTWWAVWPVALGALAILAAATLGRTRSTHLAANLVLGSGLVWWANALGLSLLAAQGGAVLLGLWAWAALRCTRASAGIAFLTGMVWGSFLWLWLWVVTHMGLPPMRLSLNWAFWAAAMLAFVDLIVAETAGTAGKDGPVLRAARPVPLGQPATHPMSTAFKVSVVLWVILPIVAAVVVPIALDPMLFQLSFFFIPMVFFFSVIVVPVSTMILAVFLRR